MPVQNVLDIAQVSTRSGSQFSPYARTWASFAGATGSVNKSFNVSSVNRNSAGNYTINFTSALPDANYSVSISVNGTSTISSYGVKTTTSLIVLTFLLSLGIFIPADATEVSFAIYD